MIFGYCPYPDCDHAHAIPLLEGRVHERLKCDKCGRVYWLLHSRIEPQAWTDEDFRRLHEVDDLGKRVRVKEHYAEKV